MLNKYQDDVRITFANLTDEDLVVLGLHSMQPCLRKLSLDFGSWLHNACRAEFDRRQGHDADCATLPDADGMTDGTVADVLTAAMALSDATVTQTSDNFATAMVVWLTLVCVTRLKCREIAMAN